MRYPLLIIVLILFSAPAYARSDGPNLMTEYFSHFGLVFGIGVLAFMAIKAARKWQAPVIPFVLSLSSPLALPVLFFYSAPYVLPANAQWFTGIGTTLLFVVAALLMRSVISRYRKTYALREEPPTVERTKR